jgi:5-methylcytosine-specific restriction enzyme A
MSKTHPEWNYLYNKQRWRNRAKHQKLIEPLCVRCLQLGHVVPAEIADHVQPHNGNLESFYCGELQSLCKACHDGPKREEELRGYSRLIGADGWPTDKRHPLYEKQGYPTGDVD